MIGVFDSGVGGLTVVKQIFKINPEQKIIYFGDTARLPYGTKGPDFVKKYSAKIVEWLLARGAEKIVIACHTSSALAGDSLRESFKGVPIIDMISPTAERISKMYRRVGVIGTPGTIKSQSWDRALLERNPKIRISSKACPLFVPLAEEGFVSEKATKEIAKKYLKYFKKIDALILACTHYPILRKVIEKEVGEDIEIVDPGKILAEQLKGEEAKGKSEFYFSDTPYNLKKIAKLCLNKEINAIISDPF